MTIPDPILDAMLTEAQGDEIHLCSAEPTTYTEATTTLQLATEAVVGGDYAKAAGDVSGRKNTLTPGTGTTVDNTGLATFAAVTNAGDTSLRLTSALTTNVSLTATGTANMQPFDHELADPT